MIKKFPEKKEDLIRINLEKIQTKKRKYKFRKEFVNY